MCVRTCACNREREGCVYMDHASSWICMTWTDAGNGQRITHRRGYNQSPSTRVVDRVHFVTRSRFTTLTPGNGNQALTIQQSSPLNFAKTYVWVWSGRLLTTSKLLCSTYLKSKGSVRWRPFYWMCILGRTLYPTAAYLLDIKRNLNNPPKREKRKLVCVVEGCTSGQSIELPYSGKLSLVQNFTESLQMLQKKFSWL